MLFPLVYISQGYEFIHSPATQVHVLKHGTLMLTYTHVCQDRPIKVMFTAARFIAAPNIKLPKYP